MSRFQSIRVPVRKMSISSPAELTHAWILKVTHSTSFVCVCVCEGGSDFLCVCVYVRESKEKREREREREHKRVFIPYTVSV